MSVTISVCPIYDHNTDLCVIAAHLDENLDLDFKSVRITGKNCISLAIDCRSFTIQEDRIKEETTIQGNELLCKKFQGKISTGLTRHRENREFGYSFFQTGNFPKILKTCFYTGNLPPTQGKF